MESFKYRGQVVDEVAVESLRKIIIAHPELSRWALSRKVCELWDWKQPNGHLKDVQCRGLMLRLHRAGELELPPTRRVTHNPLEKKRRKPAPVDIDESPLQGRLADLGPLQFRQVRRTPAEALFNGLIEQHHYLGYTHPVGEHLKFLVTAGDRPVACFAWSSAPRHLGPRDRFIGWSMAARCRNIRFVAYNSRFLVLPWVQVRYLASHLLGRMTRSLSQHWEQLYEHPIYFAETFVDPARFAGTCYRAANWLPMGQTTGRGKADMTHKANRPLKDVLGLALTRHFRSLLEHS